MDEQGESRWLDVSGEDSGLGSNSQVGAENTSNLLAGEEGGAVRASRSMPADLVQRVGETANMVELLLRDLWTQAELEAEDVRDSARRQAETLIAEAQRTARRTLEQAKDRAEIIVGAAKMEATKVASDAERLAREFLGRLSSLVAPPDIDAGGHAVAERSDSPD